MRGAVGLLVLLSRPDKWIAMERFGCEAADGDWGDLAELPRVGFMEDGRKYVLVMKLHDARNGGGCGHGLLEIGFWWAETASNWR